ncbi:hypothetical protein [Chryseolinea lacunae]|uniref:Uncharacterized protein n=1 Tax=Chryseolinea lacunae TaxID=2801331 RepID=A0ABS1KWS2_9BACT|nr:hypothetical protein [Chryseolinea lacunae]MBL0743137.1 hypothetical protein [Chryseolinea lacunae]
MALVLKKIKEAYVIHYTSQRVTGKLTLSLHTKDMPEKTAHQIDALCSMSATQPCTYALDHKQEKALMGIVSKIQSEKTSDYLFTDALQKTYRVELVHFITKIHHAHYPVR